MGDALLPGSLSGPSGASVFVPGKCRLGHKRDWEPVAIPWPLVIMAGDCISVVDEDGVILGGLPGTVALLPFTVEDASLGDWQAVVAWAERLLDTAFAPATITSIHKDGS